MRRLLLALVALLSASPAVAWWDYGHQTIARIAWIEAAPATRAAIDRLLRRSALLDTPSCPARTIAQASVWPDCVKTLGERFSYAYGWHFQDFDVCRPFDPKAACAGGNCVTAQIARNQRLLGDRTVPPRERLMALAFLVHFVGDLHQPLHAAERDGDQGGNKVKTGYGARAANLHSIWDGLLAERAISTPPGGARGLIAGLAPADKARLAAGTPIDWAEQSWRIARDTVYPAASGGAPACPAAAPVALDAATIDRLVPVVRAQVLAGGVRLAKMLDDAFAGRVAARERRG